jgi:tetratricopeptide (TPR) repeat protein
VELDPNSGQANYNLSVVLRFAGKSKEAIPVMQKALRLEPIPPDNYLGNLALTYLQAGDCKEAIATCDKVLKRKPDNLVSYIVMSGVYGFCGSREKEARKAATGILRLNPKFAVDSFMRSIPYKNQSDRDRMIQGLRKAGL